MNKKDFQKEVDAFKKTLDAAFKVAVDINNERLKLLENNEQLITSVRLLTTEMQDLIAHLKTFYNATNDVNIKDAEDLVNRMIRMHKHA